MDKTFYAYIREEFTRRPLVAFGIRVASPTWLVIAGAAVSSKDQFTYKDARDIVDERLDRTSTAALTDDSIQLAGGIAEHSAVISLSYLLDHLLQPDMDMVVRALLDATSCYSKGTDIYKVDRDGLGISASIVSSLWWIIRYNARQGLLDLNAACRDLSRPVMTDDRKLAKHIRLILYA